MKKQYSFNINKQAKNIITHLQKNNYEAVLAGGCVRDLILGREPKDWDIATSATPNEVEKLFKNTKAVGKAFGVMLVRFGGEEFEVATFRKDGDYEDGRRPFSVKFSSMKEDAARRDFTCNAMFYEPLKRKLYDFFNGQKDLEEKKLRFVGEVGDRIKEDHLRIMRAVRFAADLNLRITIDDMTIINSRAYLLNKISKERKRMELLKILSVKNVMYAITMMQKLNIFVYLMYHVWELENCQQDWLHHPEGNVYIHTKLLVSYLPKNPLLRLAGILHDIGKPACTEIKDGRITSHGHDKVGAEMAEKILREMKFSNKEIKYVVFLVKNHMKIKKIKEMKTSTIRKLMAEEYFDDLVELAKADVKASGFPFELDWLEIIEDYRKRFKEEKMKPKPIINGRDLISMGLTPGRHFGKILSEVYNLQLDGRFISKAEAKKYVINKFET